MDPGVRTFLWVVATGGFFAVLGGVFGCITGVITWKGGRAAGTFVGASVAQAFARAAGKELSRTTRGALTGGVDGFVFLGLLGTVIGAIVAWQRPQEWQTLRPLALTGLSLVGAALGFGGLAYILRQQGRTGVLGLFGGGLSGAILGAALGGVDGLFPGILAGALLGTGLSALLGKPQP
jgi:hypothetical protein